MRKLEKQILAVLITAAISTFIVPMVQSAPSEATLVAAYKAYYDVMKAVVEEHGFCDDANKTGVFALEGVHYAELVDFDNDGLPELVFSLVYDTEVAVCRYFVYGYSSGRAVLLFSGDSGYMSTGGNFFHITTGTNGVKYLQDFMRHRLSTYDDFYTLQNGVWIKALRLNSQGHWTENGLYYLNSQPVSEEVYANAPRTILGITNYHEFHDSNSVWDSGTVLPSHKKPAVSGRRLFLFGVDSCTTASGTAEPSPCPLKPQAGG